MNEGAKSRDMSTIFLLIPTIGFTVGFVRTYRNYTVRDRCEGQGGVGQATEQDE